MKEREIIITTDIIKQKGFIYFVTTMDNGCIQIEKAKATGRPSLKRLKKEKQEEELQKQNE